MTHMVVTWEEHEAALKAKDDVIQQLSKLTDHQQQRIEKLVKQVRRGRTGS